MLSAILDFVSPARAAAPAAPAVPAAPRFVVNQGASSAISLPLLEGDGDGRLPIEMKPVALPFCPGKVAFTLENVLTPGECETLIARTEAAGYEAALLNIGGGRQMYDPQVRSSDRCIVDSPVDANAIFARIAAFLPQTWTDRNGGAWDVVTLNERLRFLRYDDGQYFAPHSDGCYVRDNGERSFVTIQLYLNGGFEGGSTRFLNPRNEEEFVDVVPQPGLVLVFQHDMLHEGALLVHGRKYAVRTDLMFAPQRPQSA